MYNSNTSHLIAAGTFDTAYGKNLPSMSPLYLCMKLNFVSSVEDVPKTYIPVQ